MKKFIALVLILAVAIGGAFFQFPYLRTVFDTTGPTILISEPLTLDGVASATITVGHERSPPGKLSVVAIQGEKRKVLLEVVPTSNELSQVFNIPIPKSADGFVDGKAMIAATAASSGIWGTTSVAERELLIDSRMPRIEVLSLQHVVAQGGAELLVVRASDENLTSVGLNVANINFPAFKLSEFDQALANQGDLYGILFALPLEFERTTDKIEAYSTDAAGNIRKVGVSFRIAPARRSDVTPKLTTDFIKRKIPDLLASYSRRSKATVPTETQLDGADEPTLIASFKLVNETYRELLQDELKKMLYGKITPKKWDGDFIKPMGSATTSVFGERRAYSLNGNPAGGSIHYGLDLASVYNDSVKATNSGTVLFAGEFGIYGETVIIDHGLGLSSLYGHLSSLTVQAGDQVTTGQEVGRSGQTGLAGGDHLHFEYRLNNVPVTPREWWDPKWIVDHVTGKVAAERETEEPSVR